MTRPELTIVVPVFNNAGSLPALHERLSSTLQSMDSTHEIIYVNDGSTDSSYDVLVGLHARSENVKVIDLAQNSGQSSAVLAAFGLAGGNIVVTIDADLENHPEDIPALVEAVRDGVEMVCGVRTGREAPLVTRRGPSWIANRLVGKALGVELQDWGCGLNAAEATLVERLLDRDPPSTLPKIEAAMMASSIAEVPVAHSEREHGRSGYSVWRLCGFAATFLASFSISGTFTRLFSGAAPSFSAVASWALLAVTAIIVKAGRVLSLSRSKPGRFEVREVLE